MILLVGGEKGGTGKSCLAQHLAVYFSLQDNANVILVDCEPKHGTTDWVQRRQLKPGLPWLNCVQMYGNIRYELKSLEHHYEVVIVDCGAQDSIALRSALLVANHALFPLQPRVRDLATIPQLQELIRSCQQANPNLNAACVLNQCFDATSDAVSAAKAQLLQAKLTVLETTMSYRDAYDSSALQGLTVFEVDAAGAAVAEISAIANELKQLGLEQLQDDTTLMRRSV